MAKRANDVRSLPFLTKVSRIALVKPQKADAISDILLRMAQSGQVRQRVTEDQLILLLDQLDQASAHESSKITVR